MPKLTFQRMHPVSNFHGNESGAILGHGIPFFLIKRPKCFKWLRSKVRHSRPRQVTNYSNTKSTIVAWNTTIQRFMPVFLSVSAAHILERARKVCRDRVPTWTSTGVVMSHTYTESESHIQYDAAPGKPFQHNCPFLPLSVLFLQLLNASEINIVHKIHYESLIFQFASSLQTVYQA